MSRLAWRQILITFAQSMTPSPQAQPTGCAGHFAALGRALFDGDILGVQMNEAFDNAFEPGIGIMTAQEGIAGVEVDADRPALDQGMDAIEAFGELAVLLMALEADQNTTRFGHLRGFHDRVAHQGVILLFSRPRLFGAFIRVDDRCAAFGGEADGLFQVFDADFRFAEGSMR
jgi:hypothetical protein